MEVKKDKNELEKELFIENLVKETTQDFIERQKERLFLERKWELNLDFLEGNQYVSINKMGDITDNNKDFYWQKREVFNRIAPIIETRLAKFARIKPVISVRPKTDDDVDTENANLSQTLLNSVMERQEIKNTVSKVTMWSEICGTGFYKVIWDNNGGEMVGNVDDQNVYEGDVKVLSVSPFEIFPSNLNTEDLEDMDSIIHARALSVEDIYRKYGVLVEGNDIDIYALNSIKSSDGSDKKTVIKNSAVVIEKYEKPTMEFPNGRIITVANDKLLYYGELPYVNGKNKSRTYPFIKQVSKGSAGSFFGSSVIERLIPVQRSYNAVKNRKHEFLNRLSAGVMMVEDGSVDVEDLQEEGLSPGKVLVYRQGSKSPEMMSDLQMPSEFDSEEDKLSNEFVTISGVADVSSSSYNARLTSGTALQLLIEQDNERLVVTAELIRNCYLELAKHIIRLYSQFMGKVRAIKTKCEKSKTKIVYVDKKCVNSDDVYLENENELLYSNATKKEMLLSLYKSGILSDKEGNIRNTTKEKLLSLLGYKDLDYQKGVSRLHEEKAQYENDKIRKHGLDIEEIDNDEIHIDEHTRYILSEYEELTEKEKRNLFTHLRLHKERLNQTKEKVTEEKND